MIKFTKGANVSNTVEVITNGTLLAKDTSDKIIKSRLNRLVISLQGINSKSYK